jgi:hypothetical protein
MLSVTGSFFNVLRAHTRFRQYRGRRVPFSYFARPDSFSVILRESGPDFIVFGGTEGVGSRFHVFPAQTHFRRYPGLIFMFYAPGLIFSCTGGVGSHFHILRALNSLSAVPKLTGPVFMFCAPQLVFEGIEDVGSRFHVLRVRTHFWRYRGRRDPF